MVAHSETPRVARVEVSASRDLSAEYIRIAQWSPEQLSTAKAANFRKRLLAWFDVHKRDLPWRRTNDPYKIWVSEIMLQQTRVAAVLDHYAEFLRRFPTVADLANAPEPDVLAVWSGLGYYRRARMLHSGAKAVVNDHAGMLPRTSVELRSLSGIGDYTSAAIASIAFGEAVAAVDGNVERVLTRVAGLAADGPASEVFSSRSDPEGRRSSARQGASG